LPSVPACSKCNRDWSKDGEYFRDVLLLGTLREVKHPDLDVLRAARNRANTRRKKERGRRSTFDPGMTVTLESPIFKIEHEVQNVDRARIDTVIFRTVLAIRAHLKLKHLGLLKQLGYRLIVSEIDIASDAYKTALDVLKGLHREFAHGLLKFYYAQAEHDADEQEWLIAFYDRAIFYFKVTLQQGRPQSGLFPGYFDSGQFTALDKPLYFPNLVPVSATGNILPETVALMRALSDKE